VHVLKAIVFTFDRPAWDAAYANASSDVPLQMQGQLFDEDDSPSPRWLALNVLWEAKVEVEAEEAAEASDGQARIAACKAAPAKEKPASSSRLSSSW
jgi:hypothetical protein